MAHSVNIANLDTPLTPSLTRSQAAKSMNTSERTIDRLIKEGRLKAYRFGSRGVRIHLSDLEALETEIPTANPHA